MKRRKLATGNVPAVAAMVLLLLAGIAAAGAMGPKEYWQKGLEYAGNRLYIDAIQNYSRAIQLNKGEIPIADIAQVFNSRGLAYQGLNQADKAIDDFSNAIELDAKKPEFFLNRANVFLSRKQYGRARDDFSAAIVLDRQNAAAYAGRAKANLDDRAYKLAVADYQKLLELDPRNVNALYGMGLAYKYDQQDAKAAEIFNELLKIDPKFAAASYQNAGIYSRAGKIDAGCVWLEEAVANGFRDWETLKDDPDFDPLRKTDCYRKVLGSR
jgi:tetratricopeptide (TPR) repeat protein